MATKQKKTMKATKKTKTLSKAKAPKTGQKATLKSASKSAAKKTDKKLKAHLIPKKDIVPVMTAVDPNVYGNPAHSPGHRTINLKQQFSGSTGDKVYAQNASALNHMSGDDKITRTESSQRRIISGASIEKKGRLNRKND